MKDEAIGNGKGSEQFRKEVGMMNLEEFIAERETICKKTFPIPDE